MAPAAALGGFVFWFGFFLFPIVLFLCYFIVFKFKCCYLFLFPLLLWFDLVELAIPVHVVPDGYDRDYFPNFYN